MANRVDTGDQTPGCVFADFVQGRAPGRGYTRVKSRGQFQLMLRDKLWMTGFKIDVKIKRLSGQLSFSSPM